MLASRRFWVFAVFALCLGQSATAEPAACGFGGMEESQESGAGGNPLSNTIARGLQLLEAKKYVEFLRMFVKPDELQKIEQLGGLDAVANQFQQSGATEFIEVFKQLKAGRPTMNKERTTAVFAVTGKALSGKKELKFIQIGKNWYIDN